MTDKEDVCPEHGHYRRRGCKVCETVSDRFYKKMRENLARYN